MSKQIRLIRQIRAFLAAGIIAAALAGMNVVPALAGRTWP